jgi:hypothetical protein
MQRSARATFFGLWAAVAFAACGVPLAAVAQADAAAQPARAPVVVELFTSQGCVLCPPVDAFLAELALRDDILPLALHVDYWDYIGWKDVFAQPAFTQRQKRYSKVMGNRMIYTPQMIVGGVSEIAGNKPDQVLAAIAAHKARPSPVRIEVLQAQGGGHVIRLRAMRGLDRPVRVVLVRFEPMSEVMIKRGENAGHTLQYVNAVTDWLVLGTWDGAAPAQFDVPQEGPSTRRGAVLVQEEGPGAVLTVARLD